MKACQLAHTVLKAYNLEHVKIYMGNKNYYNPNKQLISLSLTTFEATGDFHLSIAMHEVAHAIQHNALGALFNLNKWFVVSFALEIHANALAMRLATYTGDKKEIERNLHKITLRKYFPKLYNFVQ